jgi:hypothetical protein
MMRLHQDDIAAGRPKTLKGVNTMRRKIIGVSFGAIALGCVAFFIVGMTPTIADYPLFNNYSLRGTYASQLTGTINYPEESPFSQFNGSYALTGLVSADGEGHAWGTVYENYNGFLVSYSWEGTYNVNSDGTLLLDLDYELAGIELHVQMFGVLCDEGKQVRLMHIGSTYAPNMVGTTLTGSWIRR